MPILGEIKRAKEIGFIWRGGGSNSKHIWVACAQCGKERWVRLYSNGKLRNILCAKCATTANNLSRKGIPYGSGRITVKGYIKILLNPADFFYKMADNRGYVFEHRLVVAKALSRCLLLWELVHHKGVKYPLNSIENKQDNRYPENLELLTCARKHLPSMSIQRELKLRDKRISALEKRVTLLEAENELLRNRIASVRT